jgi:hypothetical protein
VNYFVTRIALTLLVVGSFGSVLPAQDSKALFDPKTPAQFWRAIQFEINVGSFDLAADLISRFLESTPSDEELYQLEEKEGLAAFLRLRNIERWLPGTTKNEEAKKNVETLIAKIDSVVKKQLGDTDRLARLIGNLITSEEEAAFAQKELIRSRELAIPVFASVLSQRPDPELRNAIIAFLPKLDPVTVPAVIALLDANDNVLIGEMLLVLRIRSDFQSLPAKAESNPIPALWHLLDPAYPPTIREQAASMLVGLLGNRVDRMIPYEQLNILTKKLLNRQAIFNSKDEVTLWTIDDKKLKSTKTPIEEAQDRLAMQYSRWALRQKPGDRSAQANFLIASISLSNRKNGVGTITSNPELFGLLVRSPIGLITELLETGIKEKRSDLLLAVLQATAVRNDKSLATEDSTALARTSTGTLESLLSYPDRRVQFQAAVVLASIPGQIKHKSTTRVVEILRDAIRDRLGDMKLGMADAPLPMVMIADEDLERSNRLSKLVESIGFRTRVVVTGRDLESEAINRAGVDLILVSASLPYPPLPDTLARLRSDVKLNALPLFVHYSLPDQQMASLTLPRNDAAILNAMLSIAGTIPANRVVIPESEMDIAILNQFTNRMERERQRIERLVRYYSRVTVVREPVRAQELRDQISAVFKVNATQPLSGVEKKNDAAIATSLLCKMAAGVIPGYPFKIAEPDLRKALRNPELAPYILQYGEFLSSKETQEDLANFALDNAQKPELRIRAIETTIRHIQKYQSVLTETQLQSIVEAVNSTKEPELKTAFLALAGVLKLGETDKGVTGLGSLTDSIEKIDLQFNSAPPAVKKDEPEVKKDEPEKVEPKPKEKE